MDATELPFAGLARQAQLVNGGEVSSRELVDACLERIERLDPELNSFRVVFAEEARGQARRLDRRRSSQRPPLHGVPVAVKDNVDVQGVVTAHGSSAYRAPAEADAELVRRLRDAGAILIGKTNMPELAIFPWTESAAWGTTRNPWDRRRSPGGSSGGSAAAVAAGLAGIGSASDGGGSIRIPAACCGLFGLKPQRGRISLAPDREHWHGLTALGAVSRSVADTALYLDAVSGAAPGDDSAPPPPALPFAEAARQDPGRLRIALSLKPSAPGPVDGRVRRAVEAVADVLRSLGHAVEEDDPDYGVLATVFMPLWLRGIHDDAERMASVGQLERRTRRLARAGGLLSDERVHRARAGAGDRTRRVGGLFQRHDVLLTPVMPAPPDPLGRFEGRSAAVATFGAAQITPFTIPWNITGQPAAAVPSPITDDGVPLAAQLVGRPEDEATILSLAAQLERETGWSGRRPELD